LKRSLFISKNQDAIPDFIAWCEEQNITLNCQSFLDFSAIAFEIKTPYDIVFFSSPRSVKFFLKEETIPANTQIACVGKATENTLLTYGYKADFVGVEAGNIEKVALEFKSWVKDRKVLFPISSISKRSISSIFAKNQINEVIVYTTNILSKEVPNSSILVFTSPSNVEGYLKSNTINDGNKVIAWGNSTKETLLNFGVQVDHTLLTSTLEEIQSWVQENT